MKVFSSASRSFRLPLLFLIAVVAGTAARLSAASYYVDYASGSDASAGTSSSAAWQHCPGDPAASSTAASAILTAGDTVYFKGGTTYVLTGSTGIALRWSGSSSGTITYDGNSASTWGTGRALITDNYGSNGIAAFSASSAVSYLTFKSIEIGAVGGTATLPTDSGSPAAARYGAGLVFNGGVSNTTIDGCVFHNLGYWFNQKPMNAASVNGTAIAMQSCSAVTINNCDFSYVYAAIEMYTATSADSLAVTNCTFHDSVCWTIDLPSLPVTATNLTVSGCTETNNAQFTSSSWTGYGLSPRTASISTSGGSSVTLSVASAASPAATYQWLKNGGTISGATNATYTIASAASTDAGTYTVLATNTAGSTTSNDAILSVSTTGVAPAITTQPASQTGTALGSVTFTVAASGTPTPTYQWYKNGASISGWTNSTLTLSGLTTNDNGTYYAVATNSAGAATSNAAALSVVSSAVAPSITTQPASQAVSTSSSVSFAVVASGSPSPTYQWYKNGASISNATNATLTLSSVSTSDAASYYAVATNSAGSATSNTVTLTVTQTAVAPAITSQPLSQSVAAASSVSFTIAASGTPAPTYQWYKNSVAIANATNAILSLSNVSSSDAASYVAVATNSAGSATSNTATLTVNTTTAVAPIITAQPVSQTAAAMTSVTFTVVASGSPTPAYQWYKNGSAISGWTNSSLTLVGLTTNDNASYVAVATNSAGSATSNPATLTVTSSSTTSAPVITTQPVSQIGAPLGSVTFTTAASGSPAPTYQWYKNGTAISGWTNSSLTLTGLSTNDIATYVAVAKNSAGSATSSGASLTLSTASTTTAPAITTQPASLTANVGAAVSFTVGVSGSPSPTVQWKKDGVVLSGVVGSTLTIASVTSNSAGTYSAVATNTAGTATSNGATLTINAAPVITTQPVSQTVAVKSTVSFSVAATGSPTPTYQWYKDGAAITGATNKSFTIRNVSKGNAGTYTAKANNIAGSATSNGAVLTIGTTTATSKPATAPDGGTASNLLTITSQPVSLNLAEGSVASFSVTATSTGPIYYQWLKNNVAIAGATNSEFTIASVSVDDAGSYSVVVNDSQSSLSSDVAALAIIPGTPTDSRLVNLSVLSHAGTGYDTLVIGFAIDGGPSKSLLVRGIGPTLGAFNVPGVLADPVLSLYTGTTMLESNTQWSTSDDASLIPLVSSNLGAFGLSDTSADSVLLPNLPAGTYSAAVTGANSDTGLALIELYDAAPTEAARLVNVSVRTTVGPNNSPTIGFVVKGSTMKKLLIRAVGPGLSQFGVDGVLSDPQIEIFQKSVRIQANDNWNGDSTLSSAFSQVGAFGLGDPQSKDAAIIVNATPGEYSAVISSVNGATGIALVEVYELP